MTAVVPSMPAHAAVPATHDGSGPSAPPVRIDVTYVDEARSHQLSARTVSGSDGWEFVVVEGAPGAKGDDLLVTRLPIRDGWEARFHQADLEGRLAQMGRYWRHEPSRGWAMLRRHPGVPRVDLRAMTFDEPEGRVAFHQFHHGGRDPDQLLVSVPRHVENGLRFLLADLSWDFPKARAGHLRILHERLTPGPLASLLTREHMDLARRGYDKLVTPQAFGFLYGPDWRAQVREAFREVMSRIRERRVGDGERPDAPERDDALTDYHRLLLDPRLAAVHRRFLPRDEEARLLMGQEVDIHRWVAAKRRTTDHASQHLLSLLEASLLARLGLKHGTHVDANVARQLRRLAYYL